MQIAIRQIEQTDDFSSFSCGWSNVDRFLQEEAIERKFNQGVTWIAVHNDEVVGFVTVCADTLRTKQVPDSLRSLVNDRRRIPTLLVGQLGVHADHQDKKIGKRLLAEAVSVAIQQRQLCGCALVCVVPENKSRGFYEKHGFRILPATEKMAFSLQEAVRRAHEMRAKRNAEAPAEAGA